MHELTEWANYYVITGSSAAALTGLMFVVITLVAGQERVQQAGRDGVETFSSPTVVHFCVALLISAILSAPWHALASPRVLLAIAGAYGLIYAARVVMRMGRQSVYTPGLDDWVWYAIAPLIAYAAVFVAAILLAAFTRTALFVFAGSTLLFIFLGIRNAWDTVTFIAVLDRGESLSRGVDADREDRNLLR
jgi:hypothetical protein